MQKNKNLSLISFNEDCNDTFDKNDIDKQLISSNNLYANNEEFLFLDNEKTFLTLKVFYESIESLNGNNEILRGDFKRDIKLDIEVKRKKYYRMYGCAVNNNNISYKNVLVRLFKYKIDGSRVEREEVDKNFTNSHGEFNFIIEEECDIKDYRVEIDDAYKEF